MSHHFDDLADPLNPYAAPSASVKVLSPHGEKPELHLFFRWEKLRLIYNAILGLETIAFFVIRSPSQSLPEVIFWLVILAFLANLCFCLGMVLNGYTEWMGLESRVTSWVIFVLGTIFAVLVAFGVLVNFDEFQIDAM
jgi:hypothetical protein